MSFTIQCPQCGLCLTVHEASSGHLTRCPRCQGEMTIPAPPPPQPPTPLPSRANPFETESTRKREPVRQSHCLGCGKRLNNAVQCPDCDAIFCSEVCVNRHIKLTGHSERHQRTKAGGCILLTLLLFFCIGIPSVWFASRPTHKPNPKTAEFKTRMLAWVHEGREFVRLLENKPTSQVCGRQRQAMLNAGDQIPNLKDFDQNFAKLFVVVMSRAFVIQGSLEAAEKDARLGKPDSLNKLLGDMRQHAREMQEYLDQVEALANRL
jgi:hypothetical protein